tara:strand:- start:378 stop:1418 length:1041 start_codon:yes stop_codon:yes gene_type:complete
MSRNGGTFGKLRTIDETSTSGVWDLYDAHQLSSSNSWQATQKVESISNSNGTALDEETNNTITVTTSGVVDNTTLYYSVATVTGTTVTSADFLTGDVTGSFTVTSNSGSFVLRPVGDDLSESNVVKIEIRRGSTSGEILGETGNLTIGDAAAPTGAPEFNWRYYAYGANIGTTYIYWRQNNGTATMLRQVIGQKHTGFTQTWNSYTEDLSSYSGQTGRIYIAYKTGNYWRNDPQFDNMELVDTSSGTISHDPGTSTGRSRWEKYSSYTTFLNPPPTTSFSSVTTGTSTSNKWNYDTNGTPSSSTGGTRDADGSSSGYYLYFEGSSPNYTTSTRYYWVRMSQDYTLL